MHILCLFYRFIAGLGFYGLNFNINNLAGNTYVNNVISGCAELPQFIIILISSKLGRKSLTVSALFLGAVALLSAAFMSAYLDDRKICSVFIPLYILIMVINQVIGHID